MSFVKPATPPPDIKEGETQTAKIKSIKIVKSKVDMHKIAEILD